VSLYACAQQVRKSLLGNRRSAPDAELIYTALAPRSKSNIGTLKDADKRSIKSLEVMSYIEL